MLLEQDCQDMTAKQLWALEPGFQCYAAKGGKSANSRFHFFRARRFHFFRTRRFRFFRARFSSRPRALVGLRARDRVSLKKRLSMKTAMFQ
jgi:hypothetical protein